jgi:hypothetical protein
MYAALLENTEVTQELLTRGADPRARSYSGQTAVMARILAAQTFSERLWEPQDAIPVLRLLLRAGADINAADDAGETPLMRAITGSISEGPERSYFGPPLGGLQTDDASPAALGRANLVAFLRDAGARPGLRNARGLTALDLLNEEARLRTAASGNQHEKLRMLLEQPGGSTRSVRVRGTVHPFTGVQRLTLRRIGIDPVSVSSDVGPEGAVDFPAVVPGVYVAEIVPPPSFPVAISPIAVPSADQANLRIALPVLQPVRIRVSFADEKQAGPFSLLLAQASPSDKPRQFHRVMSMPSAVGGPESLTIPEYMVAALSKGATVQLIILGEQTSPEAIRGFGPLARIPTLPFSRQIYLKRPAQLASQSEPDMFFYERRSQSVLTAAADGSFNMLLPEGSYVVAVGMSETSRAFGAKPDEILRSGAVDLTAAVFRVDASADREIVVSLPRNPSGGGNVDNGQ